MIAERYMISLFGLTLTFFGVDRLNLPACLVVADRTGYCGWHILDLKSKTYVCIFINSILVFYDRKKLEISQVMQNKSIFKISVEFLKYENNTNHEALKIPRQNLT